MSRLDFHFELHDKVPHLESNLAAEAETRLRELAEGHTDMIGASVAVRELTEEETPHTYQARVVAYIRPDNIVGIETADSLERALRGALEAVERQVHRRRAQFRRPFKPTQEGVDTTVYQLSAREIFDAYASQTAAAELLDRDRTEIAAHLMLDEELDQEAAYYAADQILTYAQELLEVGPAEEEAVENEEVVTYIGSENQNEK